MLPEIVLTFHCLNKLFMWSQKFCKFSAFSLEFQFFLTVGQNNFGNKIPFPADDNRIFVWKKNNRVYISWRSLLISKKVALWKNLCAQTWGNWQKQWPCFVQIQRIKSTISEKVNWKLKQFCFSKVSKLEFPNSGSKLICKNRKTEKLNFWNRPNALKK